MIEEYKVDGDFLIQTRTIEERIPKLQIEAEIAELQALLDKF